MFKMILVLDCGARIPGYFARISYDWVLPVYDTTRYAHYTLTCEFRRFYEKKSSEIFTIIRLPYPTGLCVWWYLETLYLARVWNYHSVPSVGTVGLELSTGWTAPQHLPFTFRPGETKSFGPALDPYTRGSGLQPHTGPRSLGVTVVIPDPLD